MPEIVDKVKGMFSKENADKAKEKAGDLKVKVDGLVDKAGEKMPDKVKQTYGKVSDKVGDLLPAKDDHASTTDETVTPGDAPDGSVETPPPATP